MVFSSILFLFRFLPVALLLYYIVPQKYRNAVLFIVSLIFYGWDEPLYIFLMLFSTVLDYSVGRAIERSRLGGSQKGAKLALICSVVINLGLLGFFKYADFAIKTVNFLCGADIPLLELTLPVGISFYTFQTLSYSIDVYRGRVNAQHNIIHFGAYVAMFPQLIAGPIVQYKTVADELNHRRVTADDFAYGIRRFAQGLAKKVLLANTVGALFSEIAAKTADLSMAEAWLGMVAFGLQIYFDFSGYSDMAIGMGRMLGFHFLENFDYPFEAKSITEFWSRWHISLGAFFKEYLYIPLGGNRKGFARQILNLFIVWALTGLWHGASWNFVIWGICYFVVLVLEKLFLKKWLAKIPAFFAHLYTVVVLLCTWTAFTFPDLANGGYYLKTFFGGGELFNSALLYDLRSYGALLLIAAVLTTSFPKKLLKKVIKSERARFIASLLFIVGAITLSVMFLVSDSYNPFLYFRF